MRDHLILIVLPIALIILVMEVQHRRAQRRRAAIHRASFRPKIVVDSGGGRPYEAGSSKTPAAMTKDY